MKVNARLNQRNVQDRAHRQRGPYRPHRRTVVQPLEVDIQVEVEPPKDRSGVASGLERIIKVLVPLLAALSVPSSPSPTPHPAANCEETELLPSNTSFCRVAIGNLEAAVGTSKFTRVQLDCESDHCECEFEVEIPWLGSAEVDFLLTGELVEVETPVEPGALPPEILAKVGIHCAGALSQAERSDRPNGVFFEVECPVHRGAFPGASSVNAEMHLTKDGSVVYEEYGDDPYPFCK